ncbi:MAG: CpaE family protein [Vicinamibacterales bacterium]
MSTRLSKHITVFGAHDRELTDMLSSFGARVSTAPAEQVSTYVAHGVRPDVMMIDVRRSGALPEGILVLRRRYPDTAMVLLAKTLDPAIMLEGMRAGISECLTDPLTTDALSAAIARVSAHKATDLNGDVYAFIGAKGGVGTTTLAVNAATALARAGERTLYIDLHAAGGDAAVFLGAEPRFSVTDAIDNIHRLDEAFFKTLIAATKARVDLLASSSQHVVWHADPNRIRRLLEFAKQHYRFIIVDTARSDATVIDSLEVASRIVLVTNQELATLRSGTRMSAMLRQRYGSSRVMVVVNRFDADSDISHQDVERVLGTPVKHAVPSDYRAALDALTQGTPLLLRNHTRLVGAIDALARDLAGLPAPTTISVKGSGLLGLFTGKR